MNSIFPLATCPVMLSRCPLVKIIDDANFRAAREKLIRKRRSNERSASRHQHKFSSSKKSPKTSRVHGLLDDFHEFLQFFDSIIIGCDAPGPPGPCPRSFPLSSTSERIAAATFSGLSGSADTANPNFAPSDTASVSSGATATIGFPAARIPYILLGTTTPSSPRLTVITCASAAASTEGYLARRKETEEIARSRHPWRALRRARAALLRQRRRDPRHPLPELRDCCD